MKRSIIIITIHRRLVLLGTRLAPSKMAERLQPPFMLRCRVHHHQEPMHKTYRENNNANGENCARIWIKAEFWQISCLFRFVEWIMGTGQCRTVIWDEAAMKVERLIGLEPFRSMKLHLREARLSVREIVWKSSTARFKAKARVKCRTRHIVASRLGSERINK